MYKIYLIAGLALIVLVTLFILYKRTRPRPSDDKIASLKVGDPTIEAYRDTAQKQLPYLIKFMSEHERNEKLFRYAIKANFKEGDNAEHMWVQVRDFKDDHFIGVLVNEPNTIKLIKYGDPVKINREDVEDWILEDFVFHAKVGGFSQEYLREKGK